jgi:cytochrome c peroxidase
MRPGDPSEHGDCAPPSRGRRLPARIGPALLALAAAGITAGLCAARASPPPPPRAAPTAFYATAFEKRPAVATLTMLGRLLFMDPALSASGKTSCASCHDPARAFGPASDRPVELAGPDGRAPGVRAVPSLTYTQSVPPFTEHYFDDDGNDSIDQGPAGGRTWDGRAASAHEQARLPLLSAFEMANGSEAAVVEAVRRSAYADRFRAAFGEHYFEQPQLALNGILLALEVFQQSPADIYPYSSKYDAWLRGQAPLSPAEERGRAIFNDPARGNCSRCHPSGVRSGAFPQFTDYGYAAIGVPRNPAIPANADARYYDLGLCGPLRTDLRDHGSYCGLFRTPSLRNVALRRVFFHNGVAPSLRDAVRFYAERDSRPARWYPAAAGGGVELFDDLPVGYRGNIDMEAPFGPSPDGAPRLSDSDIDDIVAFLETLTDGFRCPGASVAAPPVERAVTDDTACTHDRDATAQ